MRWVWGHFFPMAVCARCLGLIVQLLLVILRQRVGQLIALLTDKSASLLPPFVQPLTVWIGWIADLLWVTLQQVSVARLHCLGYTG